MIDVMPSAEPITVVWGRRLRAARESAGLSQSALAEAVGVHQVTITRYEKGHRRIPANQCGPIAEAVGADPAELFKW